MTIKKGFLSKWSGYPFKDHHTFDFDLLNIGYGENYGQAYGSSLDVITTSTLQSFTFYGGLADNNATKNIVRRRGTFGYGVNYGEFYGGWKPNWKVKIFHNFIGMEIDEKRLPGVDFPNTYNFPITYQTDPTILPQTWWHDVDKDGYGGYVNQMVDNSPILMTRMFSPHNYWTGPGILVS